MKDLVFIGLIIIILVLVLNRVMSGYTSQQGQKFIGLLRPDSGIPVGKVFDVTIAQLAPSGKESYTIMNEIITSYNPKLVTPLPLFTSESELNQVYTTAFTSGESAFSKDSIGDRNRMALRLTAGIPIAMTSVIPSTMLTVTYGPDGKPTYTDEVVQKTGKSINEILTFGMRVLKDYMTQAVPSSSGPPQPPASTIQMINDILPSEFPKYSSGAELSNETSMTINPPERVKFFIKAYTIGAVYMAWLAENKWKLDLDWAPTPVPVVSSPALNSSRPVIVPTTSAPGVRIGA
jgi:hypothetical protein